MTKPASTVVKFRQKVGSLGRRETKRRVRLARAALRAKRSPFPADRSIARYFLIVGHPRSGSTLLAALLDAHPDIGVAHEGEILQASVRGHSRDILLARTCFHSAEFRELGFKWEGYDYQIGEHQGLPDSCRVLGDKSAGRASELLAHHPGAVADLAASLAVPVTAIILERNPLDVVATMLRKGGAHQDEPSALERHIRRVDALTGLETIAVPQVEPVVVHHADLCAEPRAQLVNVLAALGVDHGDAYLDLVVAAVNSELSRSSIGRPWMPETLAQASELCRRTERLARYEAEIDDLQAV